MYVGSSAPSNLLHLMPCTTLSGTAENTLNVLYGNDGEDPNSVTTSSKERATARFQFLAISLRCSGVSFSARRRLPLRPPCRRSSTAAKVFPSYVSGSGSSLVASTTIETPADSGRPLLA
jgi:hypothetical protein